MANAQTEKTQAKNPASVAESNGSAGSDDGWTEIATDIPLYKPDECKKLPVVGYLLSLDDMPETDNGPWRCYRILTTKPGMACNFDGEPEPTQPGDEVRLTKTVKLVALDRFLLPNAMVEVSITPLTKIKLSGARSMWTYEVRANKKTIKARPGIYAFGGGAAPVPRQLGSGSNNGSDEIPF